MFNDSITIEDSLNLIVDYARGATMSYSLSAFGPWEGYRVAFNGTEGRIELDVVERGSLVSVNDKKGSVVDPSAVHDAAGGDEVRPLGERVLLQRHWETAREIEIPVAQGATAAATPCCWTTCSGAPRTTRWAVRPGTWTASAA